MRARSLVVSLAVIVSAVAGVFRTAAQPVEPPPPQVPRDLKEWTFEYSIAGGNWPQLHSVSVTSSGTLVGIDTYAGHRITGRASDDVVRQVAAFLKGARSATPEEPIPDKPVLAFVLTTNGRKYMVAPMPDVSTLLDEAFGAAVSSALAGEWWQSGWKLCTPVPQLGPDDLDTPIDTLIFKADGTFSVTWPGAPRTTGVPHATVPDYYGRYTLQPSRGYFQIHIDGGRFVPRDVVDKGMFGIADGKLTVRNAWFGTRRAPKKPDICELTFTKR